MLIDAADRTCYLLDQTLRCRPLENKLLLPQPGVRIFLIRRTLFRPIVGFLDLTEAAVVQQKQKRVEMVTVVEQIEQYYEAHPRGPAAVRRPRLMRRGTMWVALLGDNLQNGIVGLGSTVEAALRAFDAQYLSALRPPIAA